jgi:RNA polymerase sigma factor (sigma-70 family)
VEDLADTELISRVVEQDDREAFSALVRRYQSPVRGFLRKLTCTDAALADDLAQETFVRAFLSLKGFRGEARLSTWLLRIAYNLFLMDRRRRRPAPLDREPQARAEHGAAPPVGSPELSVDLQRALERLSEAERAAVILCCAQGFSHTEAAMVLNCPVGTVKTHVRQGRQKLKQRLQAWKGRV